MCTTGFDSRYVPWSAPPPIDDVDDFPASKCSFQDQCDWLSDVPLGALWSTNLACLGSYSGLEFIHGFHSRIWPERPIPYPKHTGRDSSSNLYCFDLVQVPCQRYGQALINVENPGPYIGPGLMPSNPHVLDNTCIWNGTRDHSSWRTDGFFCSSPSHFSCERPWFQYDMILSSTRSLNEMRGKGLAI